MTDKHHLTTSELAEVLGLPRSTVDQWRRPPTRYTRVREPISRRSAWIEVPQPPTIPWSKVNGRVIYHIVEVEAYLERQNCTTRTAERMARLQQLKKLRSESGSVSLEEYFK